MKRAEIYFLCIVALVSCHSYRSLAENHNAVLSGTVRYQSGEPVVGADVEIKPTGAMGGILPAPVKTDKMGRFTVDYPPIGEALISASKNDEGYPDLSRALYGDQAFLSLPKVNLTDGLTLTNIALKFGAPFSVVVFVAMDAQSSKPITNAQITIKRVGIKGVMLSEGLRGDGTYMLVLPHNSISVVITAPGYAEWKSIITDSNYPVQSASRQLNKISVQMHADTN